MSTTDPIIPAETARHILWMYNRKGGVQPGRTTFHLIRAIQAADIIHAAKLRQVFPELSTAIHLARHDEEGLTKLQAIANSEGPLTCKCGDTDGPFSTDGRCETCIEAAA